MTGVIVKYSSFSALGAFDLVELHLQRVGVGFGWLYSFTSAPAALSSC